MQVEHKILSTGFHYVRAIDHWHLFAQWPVGSPVTSFDVSHGEFHPGADTIRRFCEVAQQAADAA